MIAAIIALVGLIVFVVAVVREKNSACGWEIPAAVFSFFAIIVGIASSLIGYTNQLYDFAELRATDENITLYEGRREKLTLIVREELSKYPKYEKEVIGKIKPMILLNFPELKANETMTETLHQILKLENDVYDLERKRIRVRRDIYTRELSPWFPWVTSYKDFFGERNPVAVNR